MYAQPTARISRLIAQDQPEAGSPGEEERQAQHVKPAGSPVAEQQPGGLFPADVARSFTGKQRQRGRLAAPVLDAVCIGSDASERMTSTQPRPLVLPAGGVVRHSSNAQRRLGCRAGRGKLAAGQEELDVVPFQKPTGLADGLGPESAPGLL